MRRGSPLPDPVHNVLAASERIIVEGDNFEVQRARSATDVRPNNAGQHAMHNCTCKAAVCPYNASPIRIIS